MNKSVISKSIFNKTILILSFVSLLNDISSEMLYPILPIYFKSIGFSVLFIGMLEGFAEAIAGLSKGYFGKYSDLSGRRSPFITVGYAMSAISKPMMVLILQPLWVFFARTLDRLGKGVRTASRDAMLSDNSLPQNKAKVFGFHRGMDTLGAVIGPVIALIYLSYYPGDYRNMFLYAFIPAMAAVLLTLFLKDKKTQKVDSPDIRKYFSFLSYWKISGRQFRLLTIGLFAFALINSSDMFLLLMIKNIGYGDDDVIKIYIFFNLVLALTAFPAGILADKIGYRKSLLAGFVVFAAAYGLMAIAKDKEMIYAAFLLYGMFPSFTDGVSKAWISNITPKENTATALGFFTGVNSIFVLISSALAGLIWNVAGPSSVFVFSSLGAIAVMIYFLLISGSLIQPSM
ncbi:MAG: MFS transporter [Ignavibacteria bacterium]|nr:MFS transporter [Ignavibacteria bacterium]